MDSADRRKLSAVRLVCATGTRRNGNCDTNESAVGSRAECVKAFHALGLGEAAAEQVRVARRRGATAIYLAAVLDF